MKRQTELLVAPVIRQEDQAMPAPLPVRGIATRAPAEAPAATGDHPPWEESIGGRKLDAWLTARGFALAGCRVASVASSDALHGGRGRGVVATRNLPPGHVLFRVPRDAVLAPHKSAFGPAIRDAGLSGWNALIAAITYESVQDASPWKQYLDALPQALDSPLFWNDKQLLLLQGTRVDERASAHQVRVVFETVMRPFYESHKTLLPTAEARSYETYRRFGAIVLAYSFNLGDQNVAAPTVMLPMADMVNATPTGTSAHLFALGDGSFEMQTICAVSAGSEIFNTYGARPNSELLLRYGYVCTLNPADASAVSLEELFSALETTRTPGDATGEGGLAAARARVRVRRLRQRGELSASVDAHDGPPFASREVVLPVRLASSGRADRDEVSSSSSSSSPCTADSPAPCAAAGTATVQVGGRTVCATLWRAAGGARGAVAVRAVAANRLRALAVADGAERDLVAHAAVVHDDEDRRGGSGGGLAATAARGVAARRMRYARHVRAVETEIFTALERDAGEYAAAWERRERGRAEGVQNARAREPPQATECILH